MVAEVSVPPCFPMEYWNSSAFFLSRSTTVSCLEGSGSAVGVGIAVGAGIAVGVG